MGHISQIDSYSDTIRITNQAVLAPQPPIPDFRGNYRSWRPFGIGVSDGPILELLPDTRGELMRSHWTIAALLSSALIVGCNGRNNDNSQNSDQNQAAAPANAPAATDQTVAPAPPAQAQQPYSTADSSAVSNQRATTGRRESVTPRPATPSRNRDAACTYKHLRACRRAGTTAPPRSKPRRRACRNGVRSRCPPAPRWRSR